MQSARVRVNENLIRKSAADGGFFIGGEMAKRIGVEARSRAESPLMTVSECADYLRAAPSWVRKLIAAGKLPFQQQGKAYLVIRRDLDAYIERCRVHDDNQNIVKTASQGPEKKRT